jgi:hypothetical protein
MVGGMPGCSFRESGTPSECGVASVSCTQDGARRQRWPGPAGWNTETRTRACTGVADPVGIKWTRPGRRPGEAARSSGTHAAPRCWATGTSLGSVASSACCDLAEKLMAERWPRAAELVPAWRSHFFAPIYFALDSFTRLNFAPRSFASSASINLLRSSVLDRCTPSFC